MEKLNCTVFETSEKIESILNDGAVVPVYVSGSSMNPFLISRRDVVFLKKPTDSEIRQGAIVLFRRNDGTLVLHRIIKLVSDDAVMVNGDAQTWKETVCKKQILAVVTEIERKGVIRKADSTYWNVVNFIWKILTPLRSVIMRVWFKIKRIRSKK